MSRTAFTAPASDYFLAIAAFNSAATRANIDAAGLHATLEDLLAGYETKARASGLDWDLFTQAKYALVSLADDLGLHSDWDHAESWNRFLLELRHFDTSFAGAEFFDRLQRLRQRLSTTHEPALREQVLGALEVYYTCLKLGFRGRFRGSRTGEVEQIENGLVTLLWPHGEAGVRSHAWPDAYTGSGQGQIARRVRLWWWPIPLALACGVATWFGMSFIQKQHVDDLLAKTKQVKSGAPVESSPDDATEDE